MEALGAVAVVLIVLSDVIDKAGADARPLPLPLPRVDVVAAARLETAADVVEAPRFFGIVSSSNSESESERIESSSSSTSSARSVTFYCDVKAKRPFPDATAATRFLVAFSLEKGAFDGRFIEGGNRSLLL